MVDGGRGESAMVVDKQCCRRWLEAAGNGGRRLKRWLQQRDGQRFYWR
jgi:hypothetical protein